MYRVAPDAALPIERIGRKVPDSGFEPELRVFLAHVTNLSNRQSHISNLITLSDVAIKTGRYQIAQFRRTSWINMISMQQVS